MQQQQQQQQQQQPTTPSSLITASIVVPPRSRADPNNSSNSSNRNGNSAGVVVGKVEVASNNDNSAVPTTTATTTAATTATTASRHQYACFEDDVAKLQQRVVSLLEQRDCLISSNTQITTQLDDMKQQVLSYDSSSCILRRDAQLGEAGGSSCSGGTPLVAAARASSVPTVATTQSQQQGAVASRASLFKDRFKRFVDDIGHNSKDGGDTMNNSEEEGALVAAAQVEKLTLVVEASDTEIRTLRTHQGILQHEVMQHQQRIVSMKQQHVSLLKQFKEAGDVMARLLHGHVLIEEEEEEEQDSNELQQQQQQQEQQRRGEEEEKRKQEEAKQRSCALDFLYEEDDECSNNSNDREEHTKQEAHAQQALSSPPADLASLNTHTDTSKLRDTQSLQKLQEFLLSTAALHQRVAESDAQAGKRQRELHEVQARDDSNLALAKSAMAENEELEASVARLQEEKAQLSMQVQRLCEEMGTTQKHAEESTTSTTTTAINGEPTDESSEQQQQPPLASSSSGHSFFSGIASKHAKNNELQQQVAVLYSQFQEAQGGRQRAEADLEATSLKCDALEAQLLSLRTACESLEFSVETSTADEATVRALEHRVTLLDADVRRLTLQRDEALRNVEVLSSQLSTSQHMARDADAQRKAEASQHEARVVELSEQVERLQRSLGADERALVNATDELAAARTKLREYGDLTEDVERRIADVRAQTRTEHKRLIQHNKELQVEVRQMEAELKKQRELLSSRHHHHHETNAHHSRTASNASSYSSQQQQHHLPNAHDDANTSCAVSLSESNNNSLVTSTANLSQHYDPENMPEWELLRVENHELLRRVADLQQYKWNAGDKILNLEQRIQALADDNERKGTLLMDWVVSNPSAAKRQHLADVHAAIERSESSRHTLPDLGIKKGLGKFAKRFMGNDARPNDNTQHQQQQQSPDSSQQSPSANSAMATSEELQRKELQLLVEQTLTENLALKEQLANAAAAAALEKENSQQQK